MRAPGGGPVLDEPDDNYVVVRLVATDTLGLSETVERIVRPDTVQLTFRADPSDLRIRIGGEQIRGQETVTAWVRDDISVTAPRQQDHDGHDLNAQTWPALRPTRTRSSHPRR